MPNKRKNQNTANCHKKNQFDETLDGNNHDQL
jgi:hypothetical protein